MQDDRERARPDTGLSTENLADAGSGRRQPDVSADHAGQAAYPGEASGDAAAHRTAEPYPAAAGTHPIGTDPIGTDPTATDPTGTHPTGDARGDAGRPHEADLSGVSGTNVGGDARGTEPRLLDDRQEMEIRRRWQTIQTGFVDDPRDTVEAADALVAELMQRLAAFFAEQRVSLEDRWNRGEEVETEDLRVALQQYRSFFNRLLTT